MSINIDVLFNSKIDSPQKNFAQSLRSIPTLNKCVESNILKRNHGDQGTKFARGSGDSVTTTAITRWEYLSWELKCYSSVCSLRHGSRCMAV